MIQLKQTIMNIKIILLLIIIGVVGYCGYNYMYGNSKKVQLSGGEVKKSPLISVKPDSSILSQR